jgi:acyl-coenzyme A synthetase/AMP-(fatty) acid ligase
MGSTVLEAWNEIAERNPRAVAVIDATTGRICSRAELSVAATQWLAGLDARASLRGRCVAMAEPNGLQWWTVFLGLLQAGAIPAPLDATEPPTAQRAIAEAIGAAFLWNPAGLESVGLQRKIRRADTCLFKITSGSTGTPRAHGFTHAQMIADGVAVCRSMEVTSGDVNLAIIPLGHSYALGNIVLPLLVQGTAAVCAGSPLPHALAADAARWRPTVFPAVPTLLRALVRADVDPRAFASLRLIISAGAPLPPEIATAFAERFGRRVHGFYGSSETGGITFDRDGEATMTGRSVGTPLAGVQIELLRGRRFRVRSAAVRGRGTYSPPDRGAWNEHGELTLLGRTGRTVKVAGRRLDLGEIESALRSLQGVRDAYAAPRSDHADSVAVAVCTDLSADVIKAELRRRLAPWKVPDRWLVLPEFPSTARGKPDTRRLRELLQPAD